MRQFSGIWTRSTSKIHSCLLPNPLQAISKPHHPIIPSLISPINLPKSHPSSHQAIKPSSHRQVRLRLQLRCPGAAAVLPRLGGLRTRPGAPALAAEWCSRTGMVGWWGGGMAIEIRRVYVNFHWFILMYRKYVRKWLVDIFEYIWYWYEMNGC